MSKETSENVSHFLTRFLLPVDIRNLKYGRYLHKLIVSFRFVLVDCEPVALNVFAGIFSVTTLNISNYSLALNINAVDIKAYVLGWREGKALFSAYLAVCVCAVSCSGHRTGH